MTHTQPIRATHARFLVACLATLALAIAACRQRQPIRQPIRQRHLRHRGRAECQPGAEREPRAH